MFLIARWSAKKAYRQAADGLSHAHTAEMYGVRNWKGNKLTQNR